MKEIWTSLASLMGIIAFCRSILDSVIPPELRFAFAKFFNRIFLFSSPYCYFVITEIDGVNTNELYNSVKVYLSSCASSTGNRLTLTKALNSSTLTFGLSNNDSIVDTFHGVPAWWEHTVTPRQSQSVSWRAVPDEKRGFTLKIKKKDKSLILDSYLDYIMKKANEIKRKNQDRLLYTNSSTGGILERGHPWEAVYFKHPSTFETLAMDPKKKSEIMDDLLGFLDGYSFYQQTGRAWKRGYLLYGPPGTGKSSMIAAMANFLKYDIYDLELTEVKSNSDLRKLLMKTTSKSIIVIEDIDCSINLTNRMKEGLSNQSHLGIEMGNGLDSNSNSKGGKSITLSGILNFTDGLWSCCGSEKIFIFTTNHVEKLDPTLLRSGRMDMHINMSYCSFEAMKVLLKNYVGMSEEEQLKNGYVKEMKEVIDEAEMTPADISEVLIKNRRNKDNALMELLESLKMRVERKRKKRMSWIEEMSAAREILKEEDNRELE